VFFGVLDGQFLMCYSDYGKSKFLSYRMLKMILSYYYMALDSIQKNVDLKELFSCV
jgi:hypothetical protein